MAKTYTTKTAIEQYLDITLSETNITDAQITEWIDAMSELIDKKTNREIFAEGETTRVYDGDNTKILLIDDCHSISDVTVNGVSVEVYEYPANKGYTSRIEMDGASFTKGKQNVEVTAVFSMHAELPNDIKTACTILVAGLVNNALYGDKRGVSEQFDNYRITYTNDAQKTDYERLESILKQYKRIAL